MTLAAIACPDPVIIFEPKGLYWSKGPLMVRPPVPPGPADGADVTADWEILNKARIIRASGGHLTADNPQSSVGGASASAVAASASIRHKASSPGTESRLGVTEALVRDAAGQVADVTLAAYGPSVPQALVAAEQLAAQGVAAEVIDLRAISPIDFDGIERSVRQTGRLVVVHEAPVFFGAGAEIAARVTERCFYLLEAPVLRVGGYHAPYPPALIEHDYLPGPGRIVAAVHQALAY
jgi:pyruvate/2-oxoglutarate/acetoin dehydrogenase E1 component